MLYMLHNITFCALKLVYEVIILYMLLKYSTSSSCWLSKKCLIEKVLFPQITLTH